MDERKRQFLVRLRDLFRAEAAEHIAVIGSALVEIEKHVEADRMPLLEKIFRECHSLKGASRSVSLPHVESVCQHMESVVAAAQNSKIVPSQAIMDVLYQALSFLEASCADPQAALGSELAAKHRETLTNLKGLLHEPSHGSEPEVVKPVAVKPPTASPSLAEESEPATTSGTVPPPTDSVRVSTQKLVKMALGCEELIAARASACDQVHRLQELIEDFTAWNQELVDSNVAESKRLSLSAFLKRLRKLTSFAELRANSLTAVSGQLIDESRALLLLPCSHLLGTLPLLLRNMARDLKKTVELRVTGDDVEIDRRVLERLKDPLVHMLRNSLDHGIESPEQRQSQGKPERGLITISVRILEENLVEMMVCDDGAGIDSKAVKKATQRLGTTSAFQDKRPEELIFQSGLSTASIITDLSGRGIGLAIVQEELNKLGGTVSVESTTGAGTSFRILLPISMATFRAVFVDVAEQRFAIPTSSVVRVAQVHPEEIQSNQNRNFVTHHQRAVTLVRLCDLLGITRAHRDQTSKPIPMLLIEAAGQQVAVLVDRVEAESEVLVKNLGPRLAGLSNLTGACLSDSGRVVPILKASSLVEAAGRVQVKQIQAKPKARQLPRLLVAEDSITSRVLLKSILESAGYEVVAAVDGLEALSFLHRETFDLVVTDVDMPRMSGFELTSQIRKEPELRNIPVILLTALGSQQDKEFGLACGANAYLIKSDFDEGNLLETVRRLS